MKETIEELKEVCNENEVPTVDEICQKLNKKS
jgi:hypothetical protein